MKDFNITDFSPQDIVDTMRSGLLVLSSDLTIQSTNASFCRMFQTNPAETIGQKLYELGNGQWNIERLRLLLEVIVPEESTVEAYEVDHIFPDVGRKIMLLNARKVFHPSHPVAFFLLAIDDVTQARVQQTEAEHNWKLAQTIVDTIRDPLVILEADMTLVTASRSFLQLFDVAQKDITGRKLSELGEGQWDVAAFRNRLDLVAADEESLDGFLLEDDFPSLGRRVFRVNARKVSRSGSQATRLLLVFQDATEEIHLDRHRDILAAELAHRIKNSLQIIAAFVSLELRRAAAPCINGYQAMLARILAVAELYDVIAGSAAFGPVDVPTYFEGISSSIRQGLLGQSKSISIRVNAEALHILPDHAVAIGLIANELATNAIKYAFPRGRGEVVLGFRRRDEEVTLTVSDNGAGMATTIGGSGLGARFVEAFIVQLGGSLAMATSERGTTFTVRLPVSILAPAA